MNGQFLLVPAFDSSKFTFVKPGETFFHPAPAWSSDPHFVLPPLPDLSNIQAPVQQPSYVTQMEATSNDLAQKAVKSAEDKFLEDLEFSWRNTVGGGSHPESYSFVFKKPGHVTSDPSGYYTFVPDSVIERGLSTPEGYTYYFPTLLNENNLKEFFKDAKRVDFTNVIYPEFSTYGNYFANESNVSPTGFLIPGQSAKFDSELRVANTADLGGGITGIGKNQAGNLVYTLNSGVIDHTKPEGSQITVSRPRDTNWFEDLTGGITDIFTGLGPMAPFLLNLVAPGVGTAISVGLNLAKGNIEGALIAGVTGSMGQGIASAIRPEIASSFASAGLDAAATNLLTDVTTRAITSGAMAAVTGGDVGSAMQNAALNAGIGSLVSPSAPTQEDINSIMNLGGTPEQQAGTALLDYQTMFDKELSAAQDQTPQDIYPLDIPQEPPTSYETGIGLPGEEAAAQSQKGFGGTGNILGLEDYEEVAGKDLAEAQAQAGGPDVYLGTQEPAAPQLKLPSVKLPSAQDAMKQAMLGQAKAAQESYNQMLDQYLMSQPVSVPFIANIPQTDLEAMFSGQTPIYWQGQA